MNVRNIGKFEISSSAVQQWPIQVADILAWMKFVPVRVEQLFAKGCIEYTGISHLFADLEYGFAPPDYKIFIHVVEGELMEVTAEKTKGALPSLLHWDVFAEAWPDDCEEVDT